VTENDFAIVPPRAQVEDQGQSPTTIDLESKGVLYGLSVSFFHVAIISSRDARWNLYLRCFTATDPFFTYLTIRFRNRSSLTTSYLPIQASLARKPIHESLNEFAHETIFSNVAGVSRNCIQRLSFPIEIFETGREGENSAFVSSNFKFTTPFTLSSYISYHDWSRHGTGSAISRYYFNWSLFEFKTPHSFKFKWSPFFNC